MTDITKCDGAGYNGLCPMRETCAHYQDGPGEWFTVTPLYQLSDCGELKCDEYWRVK